MVSTVKLVSGLYRNFAGLLIGNSGSEKRVLKELMDDKPASEDSDVVKSVKELLADEKSTSEDFAVVKSGGSLEVVKSGGGGPPEVGVGAMVDPTAVLKSGVVVEAGAMVCAGAVLEENCR